MLVCEYKKICEEAIEPTRSSLEAAGYDLYSIDATTVPSRGKAMLRTGIALKLDQGFYGRIASRSSLSCEHSIEVGAGVVDSDYRGSINVILYNHSDEDFPIAVGDRIAQLLIEKVYFPELKQVQDLGPPALRKIKTYGQEDVTI